MPFGHLEVLRSGQLQVRAFPFDRNDPTPESLDELSVVGCDETGPESGFVGGTQDCSSEGLGGLHSPDAVAVDRGHHAVAIDLLQRVVYRQGRHCTVGIL